MSKVMNVCFVLHVLRLLHQNSEFLIVDVFSFERKFLAEAQRRQFSAVQHQLAKIRTRHNTTMKKGTKKSSTRGFLRKCQPPVWQRYPGGNERQERKGAVPGQEDEKHREDNREGNRVHREEREQTVQSSTPRRGKKARVPTLGKTT